jgi:CubicO group peptidase (beta-lactamase class C family)
MLKFARFNLVCLIMIAACPLAALGRDSTMDKELRQAFDAGQLAGLHSVLVMHKGEVIAESYFAGNDERWGEPLGVRQHGANELHDIRSVTKPIVGLLYGIALAEGKVPGLDESILKYFPQYGDLAKDEARKAIRVRHALSMTMGMAWNEDIPYSDPKNSEIAMEHAKDRYRFVLEQPLVDEPGTKWIYNGGAVAVIAKLIADGVGKPIDAYANEKLFKPLGINSYEWIRGADGVPSAASGLRLTIHDLAKIGQLILDKGKFNGREIVPDAWLRESFKPRSSMPYDELRYGFFWVLAPASWGDPPALVWHLGNGGQMLRVSLKTGVITVVFAGNYNQTDNWKLPVKIIWEFVVPAINAKLEKQ